jgi:hypothetical protein
VDLKPIRSVRHLGVLCAAALLAACVGKLDIPPEGTGGPGSDAGSTADGSSPDAAAPDAAAPDASSPDAGSTDGGAGSDGGGLDPGDAGAPDAGADAGAADGGPDGGVAFTPLPVPAAVAKVKMLLTGLPPTNDEVAQVVADKSALRSLVDGWTQTPQYETKLRGFFAGAFQQSQMIASDLDDATNANHDASDARMLQALRESFARTAIQLVKEGRPFNETMTTRRFMLTPKLAALYAYVDLLLIDDNNRMSDQMLAANASSTITFQSTTSTTIDQSLNPSDPNYLVFYHPKLAPAAGAQPYDALCPTDQIVYSKANSSPSVVLYQALSGQGLQGFTIKLADGTSHTCNPPAFPNAFNGSTSAPNDYNAWRMVNVRAPAAAEVTTRFWDLNAIRTGNDLVVNVPRVGFFTTLSFLGQWQTNLSNQARVTLNQTLIAGLGKSLDQSNTTQPGSLASLDQAHASPGTECYACHVTLDPLRQIFRQQYSIHFHQQTAAAMLNLPGQFAFHGDSAQTSNIFDLASHLAGHEMFAAAWVQKLCTWATSNVCAPDDPEFLRIVSAFKASNFQWPVLVRELFSSPLVTYLSETATADANGQVFPVSRKAHLCMTLSARLGTSGVANALSDVCGLDVGTSLGALGPIKTIAAVLPGDQYTRGAEAPVLANDPSLTYRTGMENICSVLANNLIDAGFKRWLSDTPAHQAQAIGDFVHVLMGVTGDRDAPRISILTDHFNQAAQQQLTAAAGTATPTAAQKAQASSDALRSTFVLACLSPSVVGVGQ